MEKRGIVIFGAGSGGQKMKRTLDSLHYEVQAFTDNNSEKWGTYIEGIEVINPKEISPNADIVIASIYEEEIEKQMKILGFADQICKKEKLIELYAERQMEEIQQIAKERYNVNNNQTYIVETEMGLSNWGVDQYVRTLAKILIDHGEKVVIYTKWIDNDLNKDLKEILQYFEYSQEKYWDAIKELVANIVTRLPCVIIDNWQNMTLVAAVLAKRLYPDKVKIMSFMHNDLSKLANTIHYFEEDIDVISAVSEDILNKYHRKYSINPKKKYFYKESPIRIKIDEHRYYEMDREKPVRIGYAGRLVKAQKRVHLLLEVIELLEKNKVNYVLEIAGIGEFFSILADEIEEKKWSRVHLIGVVDNKDMPNYWKNHDIFLSVSEIEGCSLSMLEAMAEGCVPVATMVSGVDRFITDGVNGFKVGKNHINGLIESIIYLEKHREKIKQFGEQAQRRIIEKCSCDDFYNTLSSAIQE